jgi:predicted nucleic acid-binding protein
MRVVLDADVLVDAQVRDIFLGLAEAELLDLHWSEALLAELRVMLVDDMGRQADAADRLCTAIRGAYPLGEVIDAGLPTGPGPPAAPGGGPGPPPEPEPEPGGPRLRVVEPDDRRPATTELRAEGPAPAPDDRPAALAVALACEADAVVTHDRDRFPDDDALAGWDLEVMSPGDALAQVVEILGAAPVARVLEDLTDALDLPPTEQLQRLRRLEQVAPIAAIAISAHLEAPGYPGSLRDYLLGSRPADARAAVSDLINCVGDGDLAGMDSLLSPAARAALGVSHRARHHALRAAFAEVLRAPGDWRFGTSQRVVGPDAEIVTLVPTAAGRAGPTGAEPAAGAEAGAAADTAGRAIVFGVVLDAGRWAVDDIELPDPG